MSEEKIIKMEENNQETEVKEMKESKIKTVASKLGNGVKKHKKKVIAGAVIVGGALLTAVLKGRGCDEDYDYDHDCDNCGSADGYSETDAE